MDNPPLYAKLAFLSDARTYGDPASPPVMFETHMSCVILAGDKAFKLKKPVSFPYLDYSTLDRRESACRAEAALNLRLAPAVYLGVAPLRLGAAGFSIGGTGTTVDWLVCMRRLDSRFLLDHAIRNGTVSRAQIDKVAASLAGFYRRAKRVILSPDDYRRKWQRNLTENRTVLLHSGFAIPRAAVWRIDRVQRRMLSQASGIFAARVHNHRIVDGHGDLRPEHIWLNDRPQIIDCIEFNRTFRCIDPLDEIAFLSVECEQLGASWIAARILHQVSLALHDRIPEPLYRFYRSYRAALRARLAIAHLLEPNPRSPERWPAAARAYLAIAEREARWLELWLAGMKRPVT